MKMKEGEKNKTQYGVVGGSELEQGVDI